MRRSQTCRNAAFMRQRPQNENCCGGPAGKLAHQTGGNNPQSGGLRKTALKNQAKTDSCELSAPCSLSVYATTIALFSQQVRPNVQRRPGLFAGVGPFRNRRPEALGLGTQTPLCCRPWHSRLLG